MRGGVLGDLRSQLAAGVERRPQGRHAQRLAEQPAPRYRII